MIVKRPLECEIEIARQRGLIHNRPTHRIHRAHGHRQGVGATLHAHAGEGDHRIDQRGDREADDEPCPDEGQESTGHSQRARDHTSKLGQFAASYATIA